MLLGLDVSTSVTGFTVIDESGKLVETFPVIMKNEKRFFKKCARIKDTLTVLADRYDIKLVYIEEPFTFFKSGGSSAKTMAKLQSFNGIVSWICLEMFGIEPVHISSAKARSTLGIKIPRGSNTKKLILDHVLDKEPCFEVQYTRHGNPKQHYYDMADSWVIAKAGYSIWKKQTS